MTAESVLVSVFVVVEGSTRQEHALLSSPAAIVLISSRKLARIHSGEVHSGSGSGAGQLSYSSSSFSSLASTSACLGTR